ncbi:YeiH family protein [Rhodoblastus sp.]|uniref:YeiH family protein n=1 Tax=Rhodoblastus sp. TaxID=1962975 RepID=UPI0035B4CAB8
MSSDLDTDTASVHAIFQSYDGMEGLAAGSSAPALTQSGKWQAFFQRTYPGLLVAATIALAATWLSQQYRSPVMLFALLFGMTFHFLYEEGRCVAGIEFASKAVLRVGVALLGARITAHQILELGAMPIATVIAAIVSTIALGAFVAQRFGLSRSFGVLSGGAVGICGASAALAIASVLPRTSESERDTILTVVTVTLLSTIAMITYPLFVTALGFDHVHAGIFLGGTIHDVAQVVGAGYSISPETGDVATYVKLLRVSMLLPVVFTIAFIVSRRAKAGQNSAKVNLPFFLVGFAALVMANSLGLLPKVATDAANDLSRWCLVTAIAALGMKTSFKDLAAVGWKPIAVMVLETAWIAALTVVAVRFI